VISVLVVRSRTFMNCVAWPPPASKPKAILFPSGDQAGEEHPPSRIRIGVPTSPVAGFTFTTQRPYPRTLAPGKQILVPSGDQSDPGDNDGATANIRPPLASPIASITLRLPSR